MKTPLKVELTHAGATPVEIAHRLAREKAISGHRRSGAITIGGDQTLELDGGMWSKADSLEALKAMLLRLRGRRHELHAAVAVASLGEVWSHAESVALTVRDFSDAFLDSYLARFGAQVMSSLGGYWFEAEGVQLFERVEGTTSPSWACRCCRSSAACATLALCRHDPRRRGRVTRRPLAQSR